VHASVTLAPIPESAARARDFVAGTLRSWGCADDVVDDARVVVTELVANVVLHAGTDMNIDLQLLDGCLRIGVTDHAAGTVAVQGGDHRVDHRSEVGRGLRIVDELAVRWGVEQHPGEKCVWAEWRVADGSAVSA